MSVKKKLLFVSGIVCLSLLAGCGSGEDSKTSKPDFCNSTFEQRFESFTGLDLETALTAGTAMKDTQQEITQKKLAACTKWKGEAAWLKTQKACRRALDETLIDPSSDEKIKSLSNDLNTRCTALDGDPELEEIITKFQKDTGIILLENVDSATSDLNKVIHFPGKNDPALKKYETLTVGKVATHVTASIEELEALKTKYPQSQKINDYLNMANKMQKALQAEDKNLNFMQFLEKLEKMKSGS